MPASDHESIKITHTKLVLPFNIKPKWHMDDLYTNDTHTHTEHTNR